MFVSDRIGLTVAALRQSIIAYAALVLTLPGLTCQAQGAGQGQDDMSAATLQTKQSLPEKVSTEGAAPFSLSARRIISRPGFPEIGKKEDFVFTSELTVRGQPFKELARACAPELSPATAYRIAVEFSGGKPWTVSIKGGSVVAADTEEHALALIRTLKEEGRSVCIGFFQLPEEFIAQSGSDLESALEPCRNLRMGSAFLFSRYSDYVGRHGMNFLAARQALEDLREAAGRSGHYTHSTETGLSDFDSGFDRGLYSDSATVKVKTVPADFVSRQQPDPVAGSVEALKANLPDPFVIVKRALTEEPPDANSSEAQELGEADPLENTVRAEKAESKSLSLAAQKQEEANKRKVQPEMVAVSAFKRKPGAIGGEKPASRFLGERTSVEEPKQPKKATQKRLRVKKNVFAATEDQFLNKGENTSTSNLRIF